MLETFYNKNTFQSNANHPLAQQYLIHKIIRTDGRTDGHTNTDRQKDTQTDRQTHKQTDTQTDRQTDTQTDIQTHKQTVRHTDMSENITYLHTRVVFKCIEENGNYTI